MKVLITGISGTGKSTVTQELAMRGFRAVDADCDDFSRWIEVPDAADPADSPVEPGRDWVWREDRVRELLSAQHDEDLILSGCAANMGGFTDQFEHIVLLSAPPRVIAERLATRTSNDYGKRPHEAARVLALKESIEPRLRKLATLEIDTSGPLTETVATVLRSTLQGTRR